MGPSSIELVAFSGAVLVLWQLVNFVFSRRYLSYIPGPPRISWWMGNFEPFIGLDCLNFHEILNKGYGGVTRLELLHEQHLSVFDPLALHHILFKDQSVYEESDVFLLVFQITLGLSLLATSGEVHKRQRKMLNPVFSTKHMREMLPIFNPIAHKLCDALEEEVSIGKEYVDILEWVGRAALEYIGQGGFGLSFNALEEGQTDEYSDSLRLLTLALNETDFLQQFLPLAVKLGPASLRRKLVKLLPSKNVRKAAELVDIIEYHSKAILRRKMHSYEEGEDAVPTHAGRGKDIMTTLLKAHTSGEETAGIPESELIAHMSTFIVAGHDTTKSATSHVLYVLSKHQDIQSKLRDEITAAHKKHGDVDYDTLMMLPLLDAVCRETLRVHPPVIHIHRVPNKDTVLPLLWPVKSTDGKTEIKEIPLKKGTTLWISILGANKSKDIWGEDAEEWKPERWLKPLPKSVEDACLPGVYSQMMTFIGGSRACIGFKFAEMEMKHTLFTLLQKFVFEPGPNISWQVGVTQFPVVSEPGYEPISLPLKVSLVSK